MTASERSHSQLNEKDWRGHRTTILLETYPSSSSASIKVKCQVAYPGRQQLPPQIPPPHEWGWYSCESLRPVRSGSSTSWSGFGSSSYRHWVIYFLFVMWLPSFLWRRHYQTLTSEHWRRIERRQSQAAHGWSLTSILKNYTRGHWVVGSTIAFRKCYSTCWNLSWNSLY